MRSFAWAVPAVAAATVLTAVIGPYLVQAPFAIYYLAVVVAAVRGGAGAGVLAVGLSAIAGEVFFQRVERARALESLVSAGLFCAVGVVVVLLVHQLHRANLSTTLGALERKAERAQAREVIERFAAIVENTEDAIINVALDGTVISWNPAAEKLFGHTAAAAVGGPIGILLPPDRSDEGKGILRRVAAGERIKDQETIRLHKDGRRLPVAISYSPIRPGGADAETAVAGVSAVLRDLSERKHAEAIAERESRFADNLIETTPGVLYLYTDEGRFLRWNRNFERVTGYGAAEIANMHPLDFFAGEDRGRVERRIAEVFERGDASVEADFVAKGGRATPYLFTGRQIVFGGLRCLVGMGIDISGRKQALDALRKSEERYRTTLDSILEACQIIDFDWRYLYLNAAAAAQNRRPNAELLGRTMPESWPGIEGTRVFALLRRCMTERVAIHEEIEFVFADGAQGWFDVRSQPVPEGIFVLSVDITERKQAEQALHALNESLERKVAERTLDLEAARARAESADRTKSAFLATMSHELRTPLNSIIGFTGILLQGLAGALNPEQQKQLGMVQTSARHLLELINDVLDISKIEAGQLDVYPAPFDLRASIERVAASVKPQAARKGLTLEVVMPADLNVASDRRRVEQILINLLNNAIKFTERGGVTLTAQRVETDGKREARLAVADTGIGMRPEDLGSLFQPFRQIDSGLGRHHEGTGLGLAICHRLAGLLGGSIRAESEWGRGSVFTVTLPLERT